MDQLRATQNGIVPVQLGLVAEVKYFGRLRGGWIRDAVLVAVA